MRVLRLLLGSLGRFQNRFIVISLVGFLDGCVTFFAPVVLAKYTAGELEPSLLRRLIPVLAVLYLSSHVLQWVLRRFGESFGPEYSIDLRMRYFRALEAMPLGRLASYHSGYLLSIVTAVSEGLGALAIEVFWGLSRSAANLTLFFYFTAEQSSGLALVNLVILVAFIALSMRFSQRMVPLAKALNEQRAKLGATYADFAANVPTVKRLGIAAFAEERLERISKDTYSLVQELQAFHAKRWFTLHTVFSIALITTISFLLYQISGGTESGSILILFVAAFTAVRLNAERLSESFRSVLELDGYIETMLGVLDSSRKSGGLLPAEWSSITLQAVRFRHPGSGVTVSIPKLTISKGDRILIEGPSGEGKTTVLHLIAGLLRPSIGECLLDDLNYEQLDDRFFQQRMAVVSQEAELLNISIRDNVLLGRKLPDRELLELLEELGLGEWIGSVAGGLDNIVGERGVTVSQGQKQRLNLLRGYLLDRDILLLDEPTAHLDETNRQKVEAFIEKRCRKTIVVVSHNPSGTAAKRYRMEGHTLFRAE